MLCFVGVSTVMSVLIALTTVSSLDDICFSNYSSKVEVCLQRVEDEYSRIANQLILGDNTELPKLCRLYKNCT